MNIKEMLKGNDQCSCKRTHSCDIHAVEIGEGVLERLPDICEKYHHIVLVADENTYPLCGDQISALLGEKIVSKHIFGKEIVVPNERSIAAIEAAMSTDTDLLLGIGSGVINDLCKHVSFIHNIRYVIVATAPSMDGYASVGAALTLEDMKVTLNARVPYAIVAESAILGTAPVDMIRSGYGDIVGKYSCLNDWKLAHLLLDEYFCDDVYNTVMAVVKETENSAKALLAREKTAIGKLMEGLVIVGIMMSYVGNSRPASGSEHHLSHFFEITGLLDHRDYYLHGIDVLYSAAVTAALREKLLAIKPPFSPFTMNREAWERDIHTIYTQAADGVIALQNKVGLYKKLDNAHFEAHWDEICAILREAPTAKEMEAFVDSIGLNMDDFYQFYGNKTINNAIKYAKDLKDRYSVLWICFALGICV